MGGLRLSLSLKISLPFTIILGLDSRILNQKFVLLALKEGSSRSQTLILFSIKNCKSSANIQSRMRLASKFTAYSLGPAITCFGSEKLLENVQQHVWIERWITGDGIHCGCHGKILTDSKFELQVGSKVPQPYQNTYLESGVSFLQCHIETWNRQEHSGKTSFYSMDIDGEDPNDAYCTFDALMNRVHSVVGCSCDHSISSVSSFSLPVY
ncbi:hypothetical protein VNO77_18986 [Canavalia gladiata]|uniref:Tify domain-containing protein n=1 Tax=Canavalia gladiata TaxID=3824 RepID=A0AAN9LQ77_CANGL